MRMIFGRSAEHRLAFWSVLELLCRHAYDAEDLLALGLSVQSVTFGAIIGARLGERPDTCLTWCGIRKLLLTNLTLATWHREARRFIIELCILFALGVINQQVKSFLLLFHVVAELTGVRRLEGKDNGIARMP